VVDVVSPVLKVNPVDQVQPAHKVAEDVAVGSVDQQAHSVQLVVLVLTAQLVHQAGQVNQVTLAQMAQWETKVAKVSAAAAARLVHQGLQA
jgi:hypothetical protein